MNDPTVNHRWWREPMMWLVIGGPAAVVIAGVATLLIAVHQPDPVIKADADKPPAVQARNHAATAGTQRPSSLPTGTPRPSAQPTGAQRPSAQPTGAP